MRNFNKISQCILILGIYLSFSDIVQCQVKYDSLISSFSKQINSDITNKKIASVSLALIDDDNTIWQKGFGYAVKSENRQADENAVYRVGSITKLFTATAIMQLVEDSLIQLDAPVSTYLPEFKLKSHYKNPGEITVRSLLTHESGLPSDYLYNFFFDTPPPDDYLQEYLKLPGLISEEYTATQPWYNFSYCNLGFSILGNIITRVSGMDYTEYVAKNIFDKLGMNNSSVILNNRVEENMSKGYFGKNEVHTPYIRDLAAGSILSSASDMAVFMKMILAKGSYQGAEILKSESIEEMLTRQNGDVKLDLDFRVGITFWLTTPLENKSIQAVGHGGDLPPYHAMLILVPEYKLGVVVMSNSNNSASYINKLAKNILQVAIDIKSGQKTSKIEDEKKTKYIQLSNEELNNYKGFYATPLGLLNFDTKNDKFFVKKSVIKAELLPVQHDLFNTKLRVLGIPVAKKATSPISLQYKKIDSLDLMAVRYNGDFIGFGVKIQPGPVSSSWLTRVGKYEVMNVDYESYSKVSQKFLMKSAELKMDTKNGFLIYKMSIFGQSVSMPVNTINDNEAIIYGIGRNMGETIRVEKIDNEEILMYSGYKLRKIK